MSARLVVLAVHRQFNRFCGPRRMVRSNLLRARRNHSRIPKRGNVKTIVMIGGITVLAFAYAAMAVAFWDIVVNDKRRKNDHDN